MSGGADRQPGWARRQWPRWLAHAAGLAPLAWLGFDLARDPEWLASNRPLMIGTGAAGLALLVAALACTPLVTLVGWRSATVMRRPLGLYAFFYVVAHLVVYAALDNGLDLELIWRDIGERRSMLVGFGGFLALVPLAATSTAGWQRRLGRRWRTLHRLVYLAVVLSVLHYLWLERDIIDQAVLYAGLVGLLLAARLPPVRRAIVQARQRLRARRAGP